MSTALDSGQPLQSYIIYAEEEPAEALEGEKSGKERVVEAAKARFQLGFKVEWPWKIH